MKICYLSSLVALVASSVDLNRRIYVENIVTTNYSFMAAITVSTSDSILCGGSLIKQDVVLTAAHCAQKNKESYLVYFNSNSMKKKDRGEGYRVSAIVNHPQYSRLNGVFPKNDIAVLKLEKKVSGSIPISLFDTDATINNPEATLIGWGRVQGKKTLDLNGAKLKILNGTECLNLQLEFIKKASDRIDIAFKESLDYLKNNPNPLICTEGIGNKNNKGDKGDSGGPLLINEGNEDFVKGVLSYGTYDEDKLRLPKMISMFSDVLIFKKFIEASINNFGQQL